MGCASLLVIVENAIAYMHNFPNKKSLFLCLKWFYFVFFIVCLCILLASNSFSVAWVYIRFQLQNYAISVFKCFYFVSFFFSFFKLHIAQHTQILYKTVESLRFSSIFYFCLHLTRFRVFSFCFKFFPYGK